MYFFNYSVTALEITVHPPFCSCGGILVVFTVGLRRGCWLCHASGSQEEDTEVVGEMVGWF